MADSLILEPLKASRANAKRQFLRLANNVLRMHTVMSEEELKDSFKSLTMEANRVLETNEDVEEQYSQESALEGGALTDQQRADLDKVSTECEAKLSELKELIVKTLWVKFGEEELSLAVEAAELEVQRVGAIEPSEDKEIFDFMVEHLGELVRRAKELHTQWRSWAPPEEQQTLQSRVRELERALMKLTARKAEFIKVRGKDRPSSIKVPGKDKPSSISTGHRAAPASHTQPGHRAAPASHTQPGSLPTFPGPTGDFHHWRKEWEELQEQGDPTGSREVRKVQLLSSIDDTTTQDLQLSACASAEDIFKALENHYGNKTDNAAEIVEEGDFPSVQEDPEQTNSSAPECIICGHAKHGLRLYFCRKFQALKLKEKKEAVKRLGACRKCLEIHADTDQCKTEFLCQRVECSAEQHHYSLCPRKERPRTFTALKAQGGGVKPRSYLTLGGGVKPQVYTRVNAVSGNKPRSFTRAQQEFVKKLPPELAKEFRQVFRNSAPRAAQSSGAHNHSAPRAAQPNGAHNHSTPNNHSTPRTAQPNGAHNHSAPNNHSAPRTVQPNGAHNHGDRGFRAWSGHNKF